MQGQTIYTTEGLSLAFYYASVRSLAHAPFFWYVFLISVAPSLLPTYAPSFLAVWWELENLTNRYYSALFCSGQDARVCITWLGEVVVICWLFKRVEGGLVDEVDQNFTGFSATCTQ